VKGDKTMDSIFDNIYVVALKNKHFLPHAVLFIIGMIAKRKAEEIKNDEALYLGDNLPLDLAERIRNA